MKVNILLLPVLFGSIAAKASKPFTFEEGFGLDEEGEGEGEEEGASILIDLDSLSPFRYHRNPHTPPSKANKYHLHHKTLRILLDKEEQEERINQNSKITVQEFKSSNAVHLGNPSPDFIALQQNGNSAEEEDEEEDNDDKVVETTPSSTSIQPVKAVVNDAVASPVNTTALIAPAAPAKIPRSIYGDITSMVLILSGLFTVFFGQKRLGVVLFIFGATFFAMLMYWMLSELLKRGTLDPKKANLTLIYSLTIGLGCIAGGFLFWAMANLASYLLGGFLGFLSGCFILEINIFASVTIGIRVSIISALTIASMILAYFFKKAVLIISTSFFGSFCIFGGLDYWATTGFLSVLDISLPLHYMDFKTYIMIGLFILLGLLGSAVQLYSFKLDEESKALPTYTPIGSKQQKLEIQKKMDAKPLIISKKAEGKKPMHR